MRRLRARTARSAKAGTAGEAREPDVAEPRPREADDVQIVAVDTLHQTRAETLDRVAPRAVAPLSALHVCRDLRACQLPERHPRHRVADLLPERPHQAD